MLRWFRCREHGTSPQAVPAVSHWKCAFYMCSLEGPRLAPPFPRPSSASGPHNYYQVRFSQPSWLLPIRFVVGLICCQSSWSLHAVRGLYGSYSQLTPSINTGRGNEQRWMFEGGTEPCYQLQKHSWYVTFYHYISHLKSCQGIWLKFRLGTGSVWFLWGHRL